MRHPEGGRRGGFSLVEVLAVVAIVGVTVALLLPAVQSSRCSARRVQCLNNLRQLSLGTFNYQERYETFPPGYVTGMAPDGSETGPGWGWISQMLPDLEQSAVHRVIDFRRPVQAPASATATLTRLSTMLCPSSEPGFDVPSVVRDRSGNVLMERLPLSQYVGSAGTASSGDRPDPDDGVFLRNQWIGPDHVLDGLSHTLMIGERSRRLSDATWAGVVPGGWICSNPGFPSKSCGPAGSLVLGRTGPPGRKPAFHAPNARYDEYWSGHPGGANFALCDGSVRFIAETIDPSVFRATATRAGGELIDREAR